MAVKERIFQLLLAKKELTRQEIAANLSLSMPTTLQNVTELTEKAILEECGAVELPKPPTLLRPADLCGVKGLRTVHQGLLEGILAWPAA